MNTLDNTTDSQAINAPLWRILFAMLYDGLIILAFYVFAVVIANAFYGGESFTQSQRALLIFRSFFCLVWMSFFLWFWCHGGQTLGMRAWRLQIVNLDGNSVDLSQAIKRFAMACLSGLIFGLGYIWMLFDRQKRSWHDRVSASKVILVSTK